MVARRARTLRCRIAAISALLATAFTVLVADARPALAHPLVAHPLHTTLAELSHDPGQRVLTVSLRVFADDFADAVNRAATPGSAMPAEAAMFDYVARRFSIVLPRGALLLRACGVRRAGEVLLLCLRVDGVQALSGASVRSALLVERFDDQVNMVKASYGGRRSMLLFTGRDGAKRLP